MALRKLSYLIPKQVKATERESERASEETTERRKKAKEGKAGGGRPFELNVVKNGEGRRGCQSLRPFHGVEIRTALLAETCGKNEVMLHMRWKRRLGGLLSLLSHVHGEYKGTVKNERSSPGRGEGRDP